MTARTITAAVSLGTAALAADLPELVVDSWQHSVLPPNFAGYTTVIGPETIARSGSRSVADLLVAEAGLRFSSTTGNLADGTPQLRGFGENAASRVLVMVDGRPINRADMASVSWLNVPLSRLQRVEVLRGPQTARFGDNAVAGAINLITRPDGPARTTLESAAGSDGLLLGRLSHHHTSGIHQYTLDLEHNVTDGWRQNAFSELSSGALRWLVRPTSDVELDLGLGYAAENNGFPGPLGLTDFRRRPRSSIYSRFGQADQYFTQVDRWTADATLRVSANEPLSFEFPISFLRRDQQWNLGPGFHADNLIDSILVQPRLRLRQGPWSAECGLTLRHDALGVTRFAEIQRRQQTGLADLDRTSVGLFLHGDWSPRPDWTLRAAVRVERTQVQATAASQRAPTDPSLNFSRDLAEINHAAQLGLTWNPTATLSAWLRYDQLYRLPSTDEIASYQDFPLAVPFNDQLRAETGHNLELGVRWQTDSWTLQANGFAQWLDGEIIYDFSRNLNLNLADTRRLGIETVVGYTTSDWGLTLRHSMLDARFQDGPFEGNRLYLVPDQEWTATATWQPRDDVFFQGEYQWVAAAFEGNDFANERPQLPAYGVANLLVRYEPRPGLSLYCRINNLFDERYATTKVSGVWYPAAGRQFLIGIRSQL